MDKKKFKKEVEEFKANPEKYIKNRDVKTELVWILVLMGVSFVAGALIF